MRTALGVTLALLLVSYCRVQAQTSLEEYNYVTNGYKMQVEGGLDMKKGYRFEDLTQHVTQSATSDITWTTEFKALYRIGESKPCAILCIFSNSSEQNKHYLCIPSSASTREIWNMAFEKLGEFSGDDARALNFGLAVLSSYYSGK